MVWTATVLGMWPSPPGRLPAGRCGLQGCGDGSEGLASEMTLPVFRLQSPQACESSSSVPSFRDKAFSSSRNPGVPCSTRKGLRTEPHFCSVGPQSPRVGMGLSS